MKRILLAVLLLGVALGIQSCKQTEIVDPIWDGPAGFYILLEGAATPALLFIDGKSHVSEIYVRVTTAKGVPLANETVFFEQLPNPTSPNQVAWGLFENKYATIKKKTNANGEARVNFYGPLKYYQNNMFIHALVQVDGRSYRGMTIPQDYIAISMYKSSTAAPAM